MLRETLSDTIIQKAREQAEVTQREVRVWDTKEPKLHARCFPTGGVTFALKYINSQGTQRVAKLGRWAKGHDFKATRKQASQYWGSINGQGIDIVAKQQEEKYRAAEAKRQAEADSRRRKHRLIGTYLEEIYFPTLRQNRRDHYNIEKSLRKNFKSWWKRPIDSIRPYDITLWKKEHAHLAPGTRNRNLTYIKRAFKVAAQNRVIEKSPLEDLLTKEGAHQKERETNGKGLGLTLKEERALLKALRKRDSDLRRKRKRTQTHRIQSPIDDLPKHFVDWVEPIILTLMHTGQRWSQISELKWSEVDFENQKLCWPPERVVKDTNRTSEFDLPISPELEAVLRKVWEQRRCDEFCFPSQRTGRPYDNINRTWKALKSEAGLDPRFRIHDLRHNFARKLIAKGAPIDIVSRWLNQSQANTTSIYIGERTSEELRNSLEVIEVG